MSAHRILVVTPTYDEAANIHDVARRLCVARSQADLLIADDDSPDGTGRIADEPAASLNGVGPHTVRSQGYCFQVDLLRRTAARGFTVAEVPITFVEREHGVSRMSRAIVAEALWRITLWGTASRLRKAQSARTKPARTG